MSIFRSFVRSLLALLKNLSLPPSLLSSSSSSLPRHWAFNSYFLDSVSNGWYLPLPSFALSQRAQCPIPAIYDDDDDDIPEFVAGWLAGRKEEMSGKEKASLVITDRVPNFYMSPSLPLPLFF